MKFYIYIGFLFAIVQGFQSNDCKDLSPLCHRILKHCKSPTYGKILKKNCALSCNYCSLPTKPTTPPVLRDKIKNCFTMIEQCNDKKFKKYMERNCKRTCSTVTPKTPTTLHPDETTFEITESSGISDGDNKETTLTTTNVE